MHDLDDLKETLLGVGSADLFLSGMQTSFDVIGSKEE